MSAYHMGFPGTITLRTQTYLHVIEDNVASLMHHGFDAFLFTNWHNGNEPVLTLALQTLPTRYPARFMAGLSLYDWKTPPLAERIVQSDTSGHADELETAELLAVRPGPREDRRAGSRGLARRLALAAQLRFCVAESE